MTRISDILVELSIKRIIKIFGACGVLGALCIFGWQYFEEWRDTSLRSLEELRRLTGLTVMGSVPHFVVDPNRAATADGLSESLCYLHKPGSREAEAYRLVRTTFFSSASEGKDRVIQVSSAEPGDGKTTSIANLAIAVAQSGKAVLLIDADLRRPTLHQLFGLAQKIGLSDALRQEVEWQNVIRPTGVKGLSLLTAGQTPDNPAELLSTANLSAVLQAARNGFDYVFIDTPPLLAVSDPCIVSPHVDGMLFVVRMQKNKRATILRAKDVIESNGVPVCGVIANDLSRDENRNGDVNAYASYYRAEPAARNTEPPQTPLPQLAVTASSDPAVID